MYYRSFRSNVAESVLTLPFASTLTILLWLLGPVREVALWLTLAVVAATAYLIVEWNNQCQLLRIRSRMNSVTFLTLVAIFPTLHTAWWTFLPGFCMIAAYFILFKSYGQYRPEGYTFHAFLMLSLGSLVFPPLLLLVPTLMVSCNVHLRVLFFRPLVAALLGLILPYWCYAAVVYAGQYVVAYQLVDAATAAQWQLDALSWERWVDAFNLAALPDYSVLVLWQKVGFGLVALLGVVGALHFVQTSYRDKISTREFYNVMLLQLLPLLLIAVWRPQDAMMTLPLLIAAITPFAAHYLALARSRTADRCFYLWIAVVVAVAALNMLC